MPLRKAESSLRHPAERVEPGAVGEEGGRVLTLPDRPTVPVAPEVQVADPAPTTGSSVSSPAPVTPVKPTQPMSASPRQAPARGPRATAPPAVDTRSAPAARKRAVSNRGKQNAIFRWPKSDALAVKTALRRAAPVYRAHHDAADPGSKHLLSMSPFTAAALSRALDHVGEWVDTVRNDGRKEPLDGGTTQVGLIWDKALCDRLHETWERLDLERSTDSFALTKANLAIAGILHEIGRAEQWVLDVPNDDRFTEPTAADGRVRRPAPSAAHSSLVV